MARNRRGYADWKSSQETALPPKVRELIRDLERVGFTYRGGKGSHRKFVHPRVAQPVVLSGNPGDDAKVYQVRAVRAAVEEVRR